MTDLSEMLHKNPVDSHWSVYEVRDLIFLNFYTFTCCSSSHGFILRCHLLPSPFFPSHSKYEQIKCFFESELLFCETYSDSSVLTVLITLPWTSQKRGKRCLNLVQCQRMCWCKLNPSLITCYILIMRVVPSFIFNIL